MSLLIAFMATTAIALPVDSPAGTSPLARVIGIGLY